MTQRMQEWWNARDERERIALAAGVAALLVAAAWAYLWMPLAADRARLIEAVPRLRAQAQLVASHSAEAENLRVAARGRAIVRAPQATIEQAFKTTGLADSLSSVKSLGEGRTQVNLQAVSFDALVRALAQLGEAQGFMIESVTLKAAPDPGRVQVETLVLRTPHGG